MNKFLYKLRLLGGIAFSVISYAQVGINTTEPKRTLDVNGTLRVRELPEQETNEQNQKQQGFIYNIVAQEDGTLARQKQSRKKWNLYESSFNTRQNQSEALPAVNQTTNHFTPPAQTWEIPNSELFIEVPNIAETNVVTKIQWNTWFDITTRNTNTTNDPTDRGSFRFYIKYRETNKDGTTVGIADSTIKYTNTIFMTSFSGINRAITGEFHRIGMSPAYAESNEAFFKKGKYYQVWLAVGLESVRATGLRLRNWGVDGVAETYYQYSK